jgi:selenide,water dikinase
MDISVLQDVLNGGLDKIKEAGAFLVGGHSIEDEEFKYGLSVTGTVHPGRVFTNRGARPGDALILTKPIGTGIINTAVKGNLADEKLIKEVTGIMSALNREAKEELLGFDVSACTDVTGFGLLGHACGMIEDQEVGLKIYPDRIPLIEKVLDLARMGIVPAGTLRNLDFRRKYLTGADKIEPAFMDILFDPQTSGGLLIAVKLEDSQSLVAGLRKRGVKDASIIGEFVDRPKGRIVIQG